MDFNRSLLMFLLYIVLVPSGIAVHQGKLYVLGGCIGQNTVSTSETLDLNTCQWQSIPAMRIRT